MKKCELEECLFGWPRGYNNLCSDFRLRFMIQAIKRVISIGAAHFLGPVVMPAVNY